MRNLLIGEWTSRYVYGGGDAVEPDVGEHTIMLHDVAGEIVGQSLPQDDGSLVELHLKHDPDNSTLTGVWQERTSPKGHYRGTVFHGALQLILNETRTEAVGRWVGFNSSHTAIKTGVWRLTKKETYEK